jgi:hypothetical protein
MMSYGQGESSSLNGTDEVHAYSLSLLTNILHTQILIYLRPFTPINIGTHILPLSEPPKNCVDLIFRFIKSAIKSVSLLMGVLPTTERIIIHKYNTHAKSEI